MTTKPLQIIGKWTGLFDVIVALLVIDDGDNEHADYQRGAKKPFLVWNWGLYDPIRVAVRDGAPHVVDGGQRVRNARRFEITHLPALMTSSTGIAAEASAFVACAQAKKHLSAVDKYRAAYVAGETAAVTLHDTLAKHGLSIRGTSNTWPFIASVSSLLECSNEALDFACEVVCRVWNGNPNALCEATIVGIARAYELKDGNVDIDRMCNRLSKIEPIQILQRGHSKRSVSPTTSLRILFGEAVLEFYNKRK